MRAALRDPGLDFQRQRPGLLSIVMLLSAALLAADAMFEEADSRTRLDDARQHAAQAEKRRDRAELGRREQRPEMLLSPEETKALQAAETTLNVDWARLFAVIDRAVGDDVALLAIRPSLAARSVQISGEARDIPAALAFADALRQSPLSRVVLLSHSVRANEPGRPIIFEIAAEWTPARPTHPPASRS